jgi:hypothetical protein
MSSRVKDVVQRKDAQALQVLLDQLKEELSEEDFAHELNSQDWVRLSRLTAPVSNADSSQAMMTPLMYAASLNSEACVRVLLKFDPNQSLKNLVEIASENSLTVPGR